MSKEKVVTKRGDEDLSAGQVISLDTRRRELDLFGPRLRRSSSSPTVLLASALAAKSALDEIDRWIAASPEYLVDKELRKQQSMLQTARSRLRRDFSRKGVRFVDGEPVLPAVRLQDVKVDEVHKISIKMKFEALVAAIEPCIGWLPDADAINEALHDAYMRAWRAGALPMTHLDPSTGACVRSSRSSCSSTGTRSRPRSRGPAIGVTSGNLIGWWGR